MGDGAGGIQLDDFAVVGDRRLVIAAELVENAALQQGFDPQFIVVLGSLDGAATSLNARHQLGALAFAGCQLVGQRLRSDRYREA
jgi:hypothetical protein